MASSFVSFGSDVFVGLGVPVGVRVGVSVAVERGVNCTLVIVGWVIVGAVVCSAWVLFVVVPMVLLHSG